MEVIDEVGAGAEGEQPFPDDEIQLYRMLLPLGVSGRGLNGRGRGGRGVGSCLCHVSSLPQVEKCEDENPDEIDEVPVQAGDLDDLVVPLAAGEEAPPLDVEIPAPD